MSPETQERLAIRDLSTGYGKKPVLTGVSVTLRAGEIVAVIGHNGAGKSTLLKAIFGLLPIWQGEVVVEGHVFPVLTPRRLLASGVALLPQGNRVFTGLTVQQNLEVASLSLTREHARTGLDSVLAMFPSLRDRMRQRCGELSGGEKQMVALASTLIVAPRVLLLDEPCLGLASPLALKTLATIRDLAENSAVAVLVVEQRVRDVLEVAHRVYVLRNGQVSFYGPADALRDPVRLREVYL